jgi:hypothetical protein
MVSKEIAQKRQAQTRAKNKIANDKQQAQINNSKQSRNDNRGFNNSTQSGGGRSVSAEQRANNLANDIQNGSLVTSQGDIQALQNYFTFTNGNFSDVERQAIAKLRAGRHLGAVSTAVRKNLAKVNQRNFDKSQFSNHATKQTIQKNLKVARATVTSTRNQIRTKQANIKSLERQLASLNTPASIASRKAQHNKMSRAQKRRGVPDPRTNISKQLATNKSELNQLNKALPGIEQTVKQSERAKMRGESNIGENKKETSDIQQTKPTTQNEFSNQNKSNDTVIMGKGNVPGLIGGINLMQTKSQGVQASNNPVLGATWVKSDNSITSIKKGLDRTFELDKPVKERSNFNQQLLGFTDPVRNFLGDVDDLRIAISKGSKGFEQGDDSTLLGGYFQVPKRVNKQADTAFNQLLSGRKVETDNPRIQGSIAGDIVFIGGLGALGFKGSPKGGFSKPSGGFVNTQLGLGKGPGKSFNHKSSVVGETAKAKIQLRQGPPRNVFAQDTALGLEKELFRLGNANGGFVNTKGGGKLTGNSMDSLFGKGSTKPRTFKEPKVNKKDKLTGNKGSQQILKTKQTQVTKILGGETKVTNRMFGQKTKTTKNDILHKTPKRNKQHQGGGLLFESALLVKPKTRSSLLSQIGKQKQIQGPKQSFKQKQTPKQSFKQPPITGLKQTPRLKQPPITTQKFVPFGPTTIQPIPPAFKPPVRPTRVYPPGGIPLFPAGGRGSYIGASRKSAFRKYTTTAISSDINQKILPGKFLKTSKSRRIFTQLDKLQAKEDKKTKPTFLFGGKTNTVKGKVDKKKSGKGLPVVSGNTARALGL